MFVYIAPLRDSSVFKIGKSCEPDSRLASLAESHDFNLDACWLVDCREDCAAFTLEQFLHGIAQEHAKPIDTPGGTEFFAHSVFDMVVEAVRGVAKVAGYTMRRYQAALVSDVRSEGRLAQRVAMTVRNRRLNMNIRQDDLAKAIGISGGMLKRLEKGLSVSTRALFRVCIALELEDLVPSISLEDTSIRKRARQPRSEVNRI